MQRFALAFAVVLAASPGAAEETVRCTPDPQVEYDVIDDGPGGIPGVVLKSQGDDGVTCSSPERPNIPAWRSGVGVLTMRDEEGNLVYGQADASGTTTFRPDPPAPLSPPFFTSAPDGAGGVILRDQAGNVYNPPTDQFGNSTFHTEDGRVVRCHTVGPGHTVCD